MFTDFQYRHLPALFVAAAQCWGTVWPILSGSTRNVLLHYGLPELVTSGYLGLVDCYLLWNQGLRSMDIFRLPSSSVFAVLGAMGFTQGPKS
ncbi:hypothetical protein F5X99DRAFT_410696 [Biscogniauxia marginata]|nr:hypothetical protein F5X99DRAFT_410696 [Biscogniauxia marginata]